MDIAPSLPDTLYIVAWVSTSSSNEGEHEPRNRMVVVTDPDEVLLIMSDLLSKDGKEQLSSFKLSFYGHETGVSIEGYYPDGLPE